MNSLFGLSMTTIMYVLLALLALAFLSIAFVAVRNRVMFKLGVRNIPRRRAQTILIVLGLMLSTVIISAAFATGDTMDRSITTEVYGILGSVDEVVQLRSEDDDVFAAPVGAIREATFSQDSASSLISQMRAIDEVDYVLPAYEDVVVAVNEGEKLSSPLFNVIGLNPADTRDLPDLVNVKGGQVNLSDLGSGEIYINESAAEELNVAEGDSIVLYVGSQRQNFRVKAILEDKRLAGAQGVSLDYEGGVLPLATVQQMFNVPGQLTSIIVSNEGDARGGYKHAHVVQDKLEAIVGSASGSAPALSVQDTKAMGVNFAELFGSIFVTFFLVFGLFSIGAGILLIFMIFVMLAAERKSEMGMARAVGTKRGDLVQIFLAEGMSYNVLAAAVGTAFGVLVSYIMTSVMGSFFDDFGLSIDPYVSLRSLVISYSLGVVLTFLTVTFSSWRISNINIVRAVRDIPEPPTPPPLWGRRSILVILRDLFFRPTGRAGWLRRGAITIGAVLAASGVVPLLIVGALLVLGAFFSYAWGQKTLSAPFRLLLFLGTLVIPVSLPAALFMTFQLGPMLFLTGLGTLITFLATDSDSTFILLLGLSLTPVGLALIARSFGANERLTFTAVGVFLIYIWEIDFTFKVVESIFGETTGDFEMFFLSGVMVTLAVTFLVVYNADLILKPLTAYGGRLGKLLPSLKMAIAYPLNNRARTGMTMAMFCLVVFALTMMSSFNYNFERIFISDRALGGWDVTVDENPTNPIGDLQAALRQSGSAAVQDIEAVGLSSIVPARNARVCQPLPDQSCSVPRTGELDDDVFISYMIRGEDTGFLRTANIHLQARARGYSSDEEAWAAMMQDPSLAIVDANGIATGGFDTAQVIKGIESDQTEIDPVPVVLVDPQTRQSREIKIIGVIEFGSSTTYMGIHVAQPTLQAVFGEPDIRRYFVKTREGANNVDVAREIEASLLTTGAQAESLRQAVDEENAISNAFFYLIQGFMGIGLFVGVAAVGVIAFRTVVERRQQIGMLRALGYTKGMIGLTFLMESAFIAFAGIVSGIVFALILARQLLTEEFASQGGASFAVPWQQLGVIGLLAFGFALLMTLIPSRQASSIPIADALRYE